MSNTIAYSEYSGGWPSFFSYVPERMIGMNSYFYSFKNGNLYRHNTNEVRNNFYGVQYTSKIAGVFNVEPSSVKNFNTFSTDNDTPWDCTFYTDLSKGSILASQFVEKEGGYFAYIRSSSNDNDMKLRSSHGIGIPSSVVSTNPAAVVVTFPNDIGSILSIGNTILAGAIVSGSVPTSRTIGVVTARTSKSITINTTGGSIPLISELFLYVKDLNAESYGLRGYYMQFELENSSTSRIQLYNVQSSIFKSNP
jgi:hypothetical protein